MASSRQPWDCIGKSTSGSGLWGQFGSRQTSKESIIVVQVNDGGLGKSCGSGDEEKNMHLGYVLEIKSMAIDVKSEGRK